MDVCDWLTASTHIRILLVDTCNALKHTGLLIVFIRDNRISLDISNVDSEAALVRNPVAIPERGWHRWLRTGHIMESVGSSALESEDGMGKIHTILFEVVGDDTGHALVVVRRCRISELGGFGSADSAQKILILHKQ